MPGAKPNQANKNASIPPFNGVEKPSAEKLQDYWHVHTSGTRFSDDDEGNVNATHSVPLPSKADKDYHGQLSNGVSNATAIQVDTYGKTKQVNFYNGSGTYLTIKYSDFLKLKW